MENTNFDKTVCVGTTLTCNRRHISVYARIKYESGRLSICGVEGTLSSGNALGSCGQISQPKIENYASGWTLEKVSKLWQVWDRWHLNDVRAGSPKQEKFLREHPVKAVYPDFHYDKASDALKEAGLNPDNGYTYGSAWLTEEVPEGVLSWLKSLPDSDKTPAWV